MGNASISNKESILKLELTKDDVLNIIIPVIDNKINDQKIQHWQAWERNHQIGSTELKKKITVLERTKKQLLQCFQQQEQDHLKLIIQK